MLVPPDKVVRLVSRVYKYMYNIVSKVLGHNMAYIYFKANCIFVRFKSLQVKILLLNENPFVVFQR